MVDADLRIRVAHLERELRRLAESNDRLAAQQRERHRRDGRIGRNALDNDLVYATASQTTPATVATFVLPASQGQWAGKTDLTALGVRIKPGDATRLQFVKEDQTWLVVSHVTWVMTPTPTGGGEWTTSARIVPYVGSLVGLTGGANQDHHVVSYIPAGIPPAVNRNTSAAVCVFATGIGTTSPRVEFGFEFTSVVPLTRGDAFFAFLRVR